MERCCGVDGLKGSERLLLVGGIELLLHLLLLLLHALQVLQHLLGSAIAGLGVGRRIFGAGQRLPGTAWPALALHFWLVLGVLVLLRLNRGLRMRELTCAVDTAFGPRKRCSWSAE